MARVMAGAINDQTRPSTEFLYFTLISVRTRYISNSRDSQISRMRCRTLIVGETTRVTL